MLLLKCKGVYRKLGTLVQLPGECFFCSRSPTEISPRDFSVAISRLTRNDRLLADVILRHKVPKNLVPSSKSPFVRRTRYFTSFSMTSRGGLPCTGMVSVQSRIAYEFHHRDFSVAASRLTRNGRFLADVILRHKVPKNLVPNSKNPFVRRTRCFTSFSMTSRGGLPCTGMVSVQSRIAYEFHQWDFSVAASRLTRNDNRWRRAIPKHVISNPCKG